MVIPVAMGVTRAAGVCLLALALCAGCRQREEPLPVPVGEQDNKIGDISRDLQHIANGEAQAEMELNDDLMNLDGGWRPDVRVRELTRSLSVVLAMRTVPDAAARALAHELFVAATGRDLSVRQIDELASRVQEIVTGLGAGADDAARVSTAARALAVDVTENRLRWFHRG
jgi:hypothetical protein